jgi:peptidoglycan hydrolase-like amidase
MPVPSRLHNQTVTDMISGRVALALIIAAIVSVTPHGNATTEETTLRIAVHGRVTRIALEEYVARVVAGEGDPKAPAAAQQALAITVRTYALANLNRHRRDGYDLCDATHCQVLRAATVASRAAAC